MRNRYKSRTTSGGRYPNGCVRVTKSSGLLIKQISARTSQPQALEVATMAKIVIACILVATGCIVLGAVAAEDYGVTCSVESGLSPLWKDAHKAVNIIRKEPLDSEMCCQLNDGNDAEACTTLVQVGTAIIKMCQPEGRILCTRCDWAGKALLNILRECTVQDSKDNLIYSSGRADFTQAAFSLSIEKAEESEQEKNDDLIKMRTS